MKTCRVCGQVKKKSEFYKAKGSADGRDSRCKVCFRVYERARDKGKAKPALSTRLCQAILAERGIPASTSKPKELAWVDLIAWGCIPIEAKLSRENGRDNSFTFMLTPDQKERGFGFDWGFVVMMACYPEKIRTFIIPVQEIARSSVSVTIGSQHANSRWPWFRVYENRFDFIENARHEYSKALQKAAGVNP